MSFKGRKLSEEHKRKIGEAQKRFLANGGKHSKGSLGKHWKLPEQSKRNIRLGHEGMKYSKERNKKISQSRIGRREKLGYLNSLETRRKMRESAFNYAKKITDIICPRIGKNEKKILDKLESELHCRIIRQFQIAGYFIDGYVPEWGLAIEIDEKDKDKQKDIEREKIIIKELNCKFLRIKDYN